MEKIYYVYRYIRLDTLTPFYVGKGKNYRSTDINGHNDYCQRIANKHGYEIEYIFEDIDEKFALAKEVEFIKMYKDLGWCEANYTDGGEGISGFKHSDETIKKISEAHLAQSDEASKRSLKMWECPEYIKKHSAAMKIAQSTDRYKKQQSEFFTEKWADPEFAKMMMESREGSYSGEEYLAGASKRSFERWADPEFSEKTKKAQSEGGLKYHAKSFKVYKAILVSGKIKTCSAVWKRGECLGVWNNQVTCLRDLKLNPNPGNISMALNGKGRRGNKNKYNYYNGYIFIYK